MGLETGDNLEERPGVFCSGCVRDEIGELAVGSVILKDGPLISEVLVTGLGSAGMSANTPTSWSTDLLRNDAFLMTSSSEPHVKIQSNLVLLYQLLGQTCIFLRIVLYPAGDSRYG